MRAGWVERSENRADCQAQAIARGIIDNEILLRNKCIVLNK